MIERCVDDHEEKEDVSNNDDEDGIDEKLWPPDTECKGGDIRALLHEGAQREPERVQERVLVLVPGIQDEAGDKMRISAMMISYHDNEMIIAVMILMKKLYWFSYLTSKMRVVIRWW